MSELMSYQQAVAAFMQIGGQKPGLFEAKGVCFQLGMVLEETGEIFDELAKAAVEPHRKASLEMHAEYLKSLGIALKCGNYLGEALRANLNEVVDGFGDVAWVAIGGVMKTAKDLPSAFRVLSRIADANLKKFPNGVALRDENGKILKPEGWKPPDHSDLVPSNDDLA